MGVIILSLEVFKAGAFIGSVKMFIYKLRGRGLVAMIRFRCFFRIYFNPKKVNLFKIPV